eukprot:9774608-Alexandrium_andersonii.AAC.1
MFFGTRCAGRAEIRSRSHPILKHRLPHKAYALSQQLHWLSPYTAPLSGRRRTSMCSLLCSPARV